MPIIVLIRKKLPSIKIRISDRKLLDDNIRIGDGEIWEFYVNGKKVKIVNILIDNEHAIVLKEEVEEQPIEIKRLWKTTQRTIRVRKFHCLDPEKFPEIIDQALKISDVIQYYEQKIKDITNAYEMSLRRTKEMYESLIQALLNNMDDLGKRLVDEKIGRIIDEAKVYDVIASKIHELQRRRLYGRLGISEPQQQEATTTTQQGTPQQTQAQSQPQPETAGSSIPPNASPLRRVPEGE